MNQRLKPMMNALKPLQAEASELAKQLQKIDSRLQEKHIEQEAELRLKPFFSAFDAVVRHCLDELQARVTDARRQLKDRMTPPSGEAFHHRREIRDRLYSMTDQQRENFIAQCSDMEVYHAVMEGPQHITIGHEVLEEFFLRFFAEERAEIRAAQDALSEARLLASQERDRLEAMLDEAVPRAT